MTHDEQFEPHRRLLFAIAYRMLGTVVDAEDVVQEAFLRWRQAEGQTIDSPRAYLTSIVTRLSIDHLRSARVRRETYVGPWLPEPVLTAEVTTRDVALSESLSMAFLVLLERLSPSERAALLLRDVFDYEYAEIAEVLGKTEANCRQFVKRAREHVSARRARYEPSPEERDRLLGGFLDACATGDMTGLLGVLAADVTVWSDGGGKVPAATQAISGAERAAKFLVGVTRKAAPDLVVEFAVVNGAPGLVVLEGASVRSVVVFGLAASGIAEVFIVNNPEKLGNIRVPP